MQIGVATGTSLRASFSLPSDCTSNTEIVLSRQEGVRSSVRALREGYRLYYLPDPKLVELGLIPAADQEAITQSEYEGYTRNAIVQLCKSKKCWDGKDCPRR